MMMKMVIVNDSVSVDDQILNEQFDHDVNVDDVDLPNQIALNLI